MSPSKNFSEDVNSPIAALTWQLMARKPELLSTSKQLLGTNRMSNLERRELFRQACSSFEQIFLVVDALDELSAEVKVLHELIKHLVSRVADESPSSTVKICLTSRENPSIWSMAENALSAVKKSAERVEFCASEDDIRTLVEAEAEQDPDFRFCESQDASLRYDFVQNVVERSGRMVLRSCIDGSEAVRDCLECLSDHINDYYVDDIKRIEQRPEEDKRRAFRLLSWVVNAPAPLRTQELAAAMAIEYTPQRSGPKWSPVVIDRFGERVSPLDFAVLHRHSEMAQLLLSDADPDVDHHQHHQILLRFALEHADAPTSRVLLQKGAVNVSEPSCRTGVTLLGLLLRSLTHLSHSVDETKRIFATMDVLLAHSQLEINTQEAKTGEAAIHFVPTVPGIAALQLLDRLVRAGIDNYNAITAHGTTVLMLSSWLGRADVVARLLELSETQTDAVDACQRTALHYACIPVRYSDSTWRRDNESQYRNCRMVLDLLRQRALDIDARDSTGRTPLAWACLCTKADFIEARDTTIETRWSREETCLNAGIDDMYNLIRPDSDAFPVAVAFLLDAGANPHIVDEAGHSPLDHANAMLDLATKRLACALEVLRTNWDPEIKETQLPLPYGRWEGLFDRPDLPYIDGIMIYSIDLDLVLPVRALRHIIELLKSKGARSSNAYAADPSACFNIYPSQRHRDGD
ncbi:hypothetical protein KC316_g11500 [Hortaea werneckii]|nr:hypothetical protein KC324_g11401 [Hortaea werneckii]KAI7574420.1 hypothetical protein KC316_g11500 [Hortaea werneckii]